VALNVSFQRDETNESAADKVGFFKETEAKPFKALKRSF
jgi:hypothetical protein